MGRSVLGVWLLLVASGTILRPARSAFNRADWTLPQGFDIELYAPGRVENARSLALSGNSKPNGPWITYISAMSFAGKPQSVSAGRHLPAVWCPPGGSCPQKLPAPAQLPACFCELKASPSPSLPADQGCGGSDRPWRG